MRNGWIWILSILLLAGCEAATDAGAGSGAGAGADAGADSALTDDVAKASYALGYSVGQNVTAGFAGNVELEAFVQGARDAFAGGASAVSAEEGERTLGLLAAARDAAAQEEAMASQAAGAEFLAENSSREGVVTLESGLQYQVLTAAEGDKPGPTDTVVTHYHGTLVDGSVFDSSVERGEPATFPVNGVISGWTEALQLMSVGAKWRLFLPPELGYGDRPPPRSGITPGAVLIFDVELLEIR